LGLKTKHSDNPARITGGEERGFTFFTNIGNFPTEDIRLEVFTAVTMKNVVFWDTKTQFVPQRRYITSLLQSPAG
jgi:hypothetical protein